MCGVRRRAGPPHPREVRAGHRPGLLRYQQGAVCHQCWCSSFAPVSSRSPDPLVCICNAGFGDQPAGERDCVARADEAVCHVDKPADDRKSSTPAASSSVAGVAAHAGGAEAAESRPRGRPSTAGLHQSRSGSWWLLSSETRSAASAATWLRPLDRRQCWHCFRVRGEARGRFTRNALTRDTRAARGLSGLSQSSI